MWIWSEKEQRDIWIDTDIPIGYVCEDCDPLPDCYASKCKCDCHRS